VCHAFNTNNGLHAYIFFGLQEEIKITGVTTFVNPYTEPDEEEEQANAKDKNANDEENVCSIIFEITHCLYFSLSLLQGFCELIL